MNAATLQLADARRMMDSLSPLERAALLGEMTSSPGEMNAFDLDPRYEDQVAA